MAESGYIWPVVDVQIKYRGTIAYDQKVLVTATLVEYENRLKIAYSVKNAQGKLLTRGETTQVAVNLETNELEFCSPDCVIQKVNSAKQ